MLFASGYCGCFREELLLNSKCDLDAYPSSELANDQDTSQKAVVMLSFI